MMMDLYSNKKQNIQYGEEKKERINDKMKDVSFFIFL
jgi:hypothetical protein